VCPLIKDRAAKYVPTTEAQQMCVNTCEVLQGHQKLAGDALLSVLIKGTTQERLIHAARSASMFANITELLQPKTASNVYHAHQALRWEKEKVLLHPGVIHFPGRTNPTERLKNLQ